MFNRSGYKSLFCVELLQGILSTSEVNTPTLPLLSFPHIKRTSSYNTGISLDVLEQVLESINMHYQSLDGPRALVLGAKTDLFYPIQGRLDAALKTIELLFSQSSDDIIIQTRSPHILMAAPFLIAARDRLRVVIALETISDKEHFSLTSDLPRPSERLETAMALADLGLQTMIQFSPLSISEEAKDFVLSHKTYCSKLRLVSFEKCLNGQIAYNSYRHYNKKSAKIISKIPQSREAFQSLKQLLLNQDKHKKEELVAA